MFSKVIITFFVVISSIFSLLDIKYAIMCSQEMLEYFIYFKGAALPLTPVPKQREQLAGFPLLCVYPNIFLPKDRKCRKEIKVK